MTKEVLTNTQYPVSALVVGFGREGTALARFLAEHDIQVTVTDVKSFEALAHNAAALDDLSLTYSLGGHPLALLDQADIIFVSPGVPLEIPLLVEAQRRGLPLSSETRLFTRLCPAPIVGITGSSGKTTTTALVGEMLKASGRRTWVGGNIGQPLISYLDEIEPTDAVAIELSSFQLELFAPWSEGGRPGTLFAPAGWSPPIAALLNITPNHLDRHTTMEAYVAAKAHILNYQQPGDVAVLNVDNEIARQMGEEMGPDRRVLWFSLKREVAEGTFLSGDSLLLRLAAREQTICSVDEVQLLGQHNVANTLAACAIAAAVGVPVDFMRQVATSFRGVEHRLECVRKRASVRWYNDSIATSPERTVAALRSFQQPVVLLAGGRDKHLPWDEMAALTCSKVRHLILFGEAAGSIEEAVRAACSTAPAKRNVPEARGNERPEIQLHHAGTLERAVAMAARVAQPGDVVLLSPGGTSFDAYPDFVARGEHFRRLVQALE